MPRSGRKPEPASRWRSTRLMPRAVSVSVRISSGSVRSTMCSVGPGTTPMSTPTRPRRSTPPTADPSPTGERRRGTSRTTMRSAMRPGTSPTCSPRCTRPTIVATAFSTRSRCCGTGQRSRSISACLSRPRPGSSTRHMLPVPIWSALPPMTIAGPTPNAFPSKPAAPSPTIFLTGSTR